MDGAGLCVYVFFEESHGIKINAFTRKRRLTRARRRLLFARKQVQERLFFALMLSTIGFNLCSPTRSLWTKERSSYWWDHILSQTSPRDWLQNFRMSQATFMYVCDEPIEKKDTDEKVYSYKTKSCLDTLVSSY